MFYLHLNEHVVKDLLAKERKTDVTTSWATFSAISKGHFICTILLTG